eukprot:GHVO01027414.1.p1 GENE.GHVO01027414.1~~GHVO01027414.1.p1  ORF type:complete len:132 (-),score=9.89 GHVO01027414.1:211-576(-)
MDNTTKAKRKMTVPVPGAALAASVAVSALTGQRPVEFDTTVLAQVTPIVGCGQEMGLELTWCEVVEVAKAGKAMKYNQRSRSWAAVTGLALVYVGIIFAVSHYCMSDQQEGPTAVVQVTQT